MANSQSILSPLEILTADGNAVEVMPLANDVPNYGYSLPLFNALHASGGYGTMRFFHYAGNGFSIWYSRYAINGKTHFISRGNFPVLELSIPFTRQFASVWDGRLSNASKEKQFMMAWLPHINSKSVFHWAGEYDTFDVHFSKEYLQRFASQYPALDVFLAAVERGEPVLLKQQAGSLAPATIQLVVDMLQCDLSPAVAGYFYESCSLLLLLQVLGSSSGSARKYAAYDIECVNAVRSLLLEDPSIKYSVAELAMKIGIGEGKLQQCFKQEFGTTVFDFGQSVRLEYAKKLLLDTRDPVLDIAAKCGYTDHGNFSAAFKKKYGVTPLYWRENGQ